MQCVICRRREATHRNSTSPEGSRILYCATCADGSRVKLKAYGTSRSRALKKWRETETPENERLREGFETLRES